MPNQNDNRTVPGFTVYHDLNSPTGESYHCHEYHEVIFFLSERAVMWWKARPTAFSPETFWSSATGRSTGIVKKAGSAATGILPILTALFSRKQKSRSQRGGFITVL